MNLKYIAAIIVAVTTLSACDNAKTTSSAAPAPKPLTACDKIIEAELVEQSKDHADDVKYIREHNIDFNSFCEIGYNAGLVGDRQKARPLFNQLAKWGEKANKQANAALTLPLATTPEQGNKVKEAIKVASAQQIEVIISLKTVIKAIQAGEAARK
ncbi:hypothetical protein [Leclercia sp.]|uniref:hypothetical protein n=1 Tax=Leclercia sp. TaxID=1898428 RepID=UPI002FDE3E70